jgi:hypothetical protein
MSPNVDFNKLSVCRTTDLKGNLGDLSNALGIERGDDVEECPNSEAEVGDQVASGDASEWESDKEILQLMVTVDESVPNGPNPVVPLVVQEPDAPIHCHHHLEVKCLGDAARPPPTNDWRRPRAAVSTATDSAVTSKAASDHCASVGVMEIEGKIAENARKYAYYEVLLAAEDMHLHNEPVDIREAQGRADWPKWETVMHEELKSLEQHGTYERVKELPPGRKAVGYKWIFKLKLNPDNLIAQYKARLVVKGYLQVPGQDFTETTSPVARLASYHALLSLAAKLNLEAHHLDIETAFLNRTLDEEIYMKAPDSFNTGSSSLWRLKKSLYGLKQALHIWNKLLDSTLKDIGFDQCNKDICVYLYQSKNAFIVLAMHVDDMLIISNSKSSLAEMKLALGQQFKVKDLGEVRFLLRIKVIHDRQTGHIGLSQQAYIDQLLEQFNLQGVKPASTPLSSGVHLTQDDCPPWMR